MEHLPNNMIEENVDKSENYTLLARFIDASDFVSFYFNNFSKD